MATIPPPLLLTVTILLLLSVTPPPSAEAHNITAILDAFPDYSLFNSYLTQTRVSNEINSRATITCLVLPNAAMSSLASKHSLASIKNALRVLVLLDYFDPDKLRSLPGGASASSATLFQAAGTARADSGSVNFSKHADGDIFFGTSTRYTKSVHQIPYDISVLEVSEPILFPGLLDAPSAANSNITSLLENAGCWAFAELLRASGVIKMFESAMDRGFTLLAPSDEAFRGPGAPDLRNVTSAELVSLLQYHALPSYSPKATLKSAAQPIATMASRSSGRFTLNVTSAGHDVSLDTGIGRARITSTVLDDSPVCILTIDHLLLPVELFGERVAQAPAPVTGLLTPTLAPVPGAAAVPVPAPAPAAENVASPPAPAMGEAPTGFPAESPEADVEKKGDKAAAVAMRPVGMVAAALALFAAVAAYCAL